MSIKIFKKSDFEKWWKSNLKFKYPEIDEAVKNVITFADGSFSVFNLGSKLDSKKEFIYFNTCR